MAKIFILILGWPVLVFLSIYIFFKGRHVYKLVSGSMIGKIIKVLVYTMLVNTSSLGILSTLYINAEPGGVYIVLTVFVVWFIVFIWALKTLNQAQRETKKIVEQK
ncbi:hypothetical protein L6279_02245 [Candidatus Parcubacteria bacterium]|nr:hypothetical protein [Candidatus Parcubacteria bacterium]